MAGALLGISRFYPYGYFNVEVTAFGILLFWGGWVICELWDDIHIKKDRGFRRFRFFSFIGLFIAGLVSLAFTQPHRRLVYLFIGIVLLIAFLLWNRLKRQRRRTFVSHRDFP